MVAVAVAINLANVILDFEVYDMILLQVVQLFTVCYILFSLVFIIRIICWPNLFYQSSIENHSACLEYPPTDQRTNRCHCTLDEQGR